MTVQAKPLVGIIMGSKSDWPVMEHVSATLEKLDIPCEVNVISAHRTPDVAFEYAKTAEERGLEVIIAGAGSAAHLAGVMAGKTIIPVLGIPLDGNSLNGMDALLATVQMPGGIPVGTLAIGKAGAINAALLAAAFLGNKYPETREKLRAFRAAQTERLQPSEIPERDDRLPAALKAVTTEWRLLLGSCLSARALRALVRQRRPLRRTFGEALAFVIEHHDGQAKFTERRTDRLPVSSDDDQIIVQVAVLLRDFVHGTELHGLHALGPIRVPIVGPSVGRNGVELPGDGRYILEAARKAEQ